MTLPELNAELTKTGPRITPAKPNDWLGVDGPLNLDVKLSGGVIHVPVSEHGGLQITTGDEPSLNFIQADVAPQPLSAAEAERLGMRLCIEARKAGLVMDNDFIKPGTYSRGGSHDVCSTHDQTQRVGAWIDRFQLKENGQYRVLLNIRPVDGH